jgi:hypothetical protein
VLSGGLGVIRLTLSVLNRRRPTDCERPARRALMIAGVCAIVGAATISLAGSAHANPFSTPFQSPSGDITCNLVNAPPDDKVDFAFGSGKNFVQCDIVNQRWEPPQPPPGGRADATATLLLVRGQLPIVGYSPGTLAASEPAYNNQPLSAGAITCSTEQATIKCTDVSTGHFFRVSEDSYELG